MIDHRLQTLRVLHQQGTVTGTAHALHLTPSTVSAQLRQLARELDVELLRPEGRNVLLTPAALTLLEHADLLFAQAERARADLAAHRRGEAGRLRIVSVPSALHGIVAPAGAELVRENPTLAIEMSEEQSDASFDQLLSGQADIAVVIPSRESPPPDDVRFGQHRLQDDLLDILVPADHRFATRPAVRLAEAAEESWIVSPNRPDQYELLTVSCAEAGFAPRVGHRSCEFPAMSALVANGFGVALVPRLAHIPPQHPVVRVPLEGEPVPSRRVNACTRRGSEHQRFVALGLSVLRRWASMVI